MGRFAGLYNRGTGFAFRWHATVHATPGSRVRRYTLHQDGAAARWAEVIARWREDAAFRSFFRGLLADAPFGAFRWETPALSGPAVSRPFEFVLVDDPALDRPADPQAFADQFPPAAPPVATFPNLGGDAILVVPRPAGPSTAYAHLAAFVRGAPDARRRRRRRVARRPAPPVAQHRRRRRPLAPRPP